MDNSWNLANYQFVKNVGQFKIYARINEVAPPGWNWLCVQPDGRKFQGYSQQHVEGHISYEIAKSKSMARRGLHVGPQ